MASTVSSTPSPDDLVRVKGVVAAGQFTADGKAVNYKTNNMPMPQEMAQMTAQFCATVTMMFNTMADTYTKLGHMNWVPQKMRT